jgi:hypothetical protein
MKRLLVIFLLIFSVKANSQIFTQTYVDKCTGEIKTVVTTPMGNGMVAVAFYNQIKTFTNVEVTNGTVQAWLNQVYSDYNSRPCPVTNVVQQTIQNTVSQTAATAASQAASSAASSAASAAASSSASAAAGTSPPPATSSSSSSSSQNNSSGSSSSSSESKSEGSKSEQKSEQKSEEKKSEEKKSEESKEESKEESSEEKSEEKKDEKKKEDKKKKGGGGNPMLVSSDLAVTQATDGRYSAMISTGISKSSMTGSGSWGVTSMIWTTFDQFALNAGYTKMNYQKGALKSIRSFSLTTAYLQGNFMIMKGFTYIKPDPKFGTWGYNIGVINLLLKNGKGFDYSLSSSMTAFWTKPYAIDRRLMLSPQIFLSNSPITWNPTTGQTIVSREYGFAVGVSADYKLTKRFGFNFSYRGMGSTQEGSKFLNNFLIGSRIMF